LPLQFTPGEKFHYNNSGYYLLGLIIEKAAAKPYEDVLHEQIFAPLGMKDTGYDHSGTILPNRASGYSLDKGKLVNAQYLDMGQPYSAGALYSTVEDLLRWDEALYTEKLLPKKALAAIFTPGKNDYAYGWVVRESSKRKMIAHGGGINGFSTFISRYPAERATVIVLSNSESANTGLIAGDLAAMLFGEKYEVPRERVEAKVDPKVFDAYVGEYQLAPDFSITVTLEDSHLMTQATGQSKVEIYPESETKFFLKVVDAQITFMRDEKGNVTQLILHQGGMDRPAKKVH
jgi:CubicO group peptidase (beta-lactamase class C family)